MNMLVMIKDTLKANRSLSRAEADWLVEEIQRLEQECLKAKDYTVKLSKTITEQAEQNDMLSDKLGWEEISLKESTQERVRLCEANRALLNSLNQVIWGCKTVLTDEELETKVYQGVTLYSILQCADYVRVNES